MFQTPPEAQAILERLDSNYRLRHTGAKMKRSQHGDWEVDVPGKIFCEIIDNTTGESYVTAEGSTESDALVNAARLAITAPKPLTRAQRASRDEVDAAIAKARTADAKVAEAEAEIKKLRAQVSALQAKDPTPQPPQADFQPLAIEPPELPRPVGRPARQPK